MSDSLLDFSTQHLHEGISKRRLWKKGLQGLTCVADLAYISRSRTTVKIPTAASWATLDKLVLAFTLINVHEHFLWSRLPQFCSFSSKITFFNAQMSGACRGWSKTLFFFLFGDGATIAPKFTSKRHRWR